jgi:hypothetical protein
MRYWIEVDDARSPEPVVVFRGDDEPLAQAVFTQVVGIANSARLMKKSGTSEMTLATFDMRSVYDELLPYEPTPAKQVLVEAAAQP